MTGTDEGTRKHFAEQLTEVYRMVRHAGLATGRQAEDSPVHDYPEAEQAVRELHETLGRQAIELEQRLAELGHPATSSPPATDGPPASAERASDAVEGDHQFLQRLSLAYLQLQSASRAREDEETASLAEQGYRETQFLIRERISRAQPRVAAADRAEPSMNPPGVVR